MAAESAVELEHVVVGYGAMTILNGTSFKIAPGAITTKRTLTGYRAQNELEVSIRDIDKAGAIASRVVAAGANTYRYLYFDISNREEREDGIRAKAVSEAKRKAASSRRAPA